MFLDFFLLLKNDGIPVTIKEYLTLLEALYKNINECSVDDFYYLSRCALIKHEQNLDRFDRLFGLYFKGIEKIDTEEFMKIPKEWLLKNYESMFDKEDLDKIKKMANLDELMERLKEIMEKQEKRHEGGNKWIGTAGTSPFGAYGVNPAGIRIGQDGSRNRSAVKVWDKREFKDLDDSVELQTRNMKIALKRLRALTREGLKNELDLDRTIEKTSKNAGYLDLEFVAEKKNNIKVLMFLDIGGSMDDHIELCSRLFSASKYEFKHLEFYYFHNCIYERVWKNNDRRWSEQIPTSQVLNKYNSDYKCIIVGDGAMSPWELMYENGSVEHNNDEAGFVWLERLKAHYPYTVWLNPVPSTEWKWTQSILMLKDFYDERMFPLTISGLQKAVKGLKDKKYKFEN
ncbi:MAG: vWA domain-containing protein [Thermodesulfobacteriota bacterium]